MTPLSIGMKSVGAILCLFTAIDYIWQVRHNYGYSPDIGIAGLFDFRWLIGWILIGVGVGRLETVHWGVVLATVVAGFLLGHFLKGPMNGLARKLEASAASYIELRKSGLESLLEAEKAIDEKSKDD